MFSCKLKNTKELTHGHCIPIHHNTKNSKPQFLNKIPPIGVTNQEMSGLFLLRKRVDRRQITAHIRQKDVNKRKATSKIIVKNYISEIKKNLK